MSQLNLKAPPLSRAQIEAMTAAFREMFSIGSHWLPVPQLLEFLPPTMGERYSFQVRTRSEMGDRHGYFDPASGELALRDDVYNGVCEGRGRDRFTACHEIGHLILHSQPTLNRVDPGAIVRTFEDPEWQANAFSSSVLMPKALMLTMTSITQIKEVFGVSTEAAKVRVRKLELNIA